MPGRNKQSDEYRYGFNGMERDDEVSGEGNSYGADYRQYDSRLARWTSVDPLAALRPFESPYAGFGNNPIYYVDPSGLTPTTGGKPDPILTMEEDLAALVNIDNFLDIGETIVLPEFKVGLSGQTIQGCGCKSSGNSTGAGILFGALGEAGHDILDAAGTIPLIGEVADGINGLWYTLEGDYVNAGFSFGAMIPFLGWGSTGAKWTYKGAKYIDDGADLVSQSNKLKVDPNTLIRTERGRTWKESTRNVADIMGSAKDKGILKPVDVYQLNGKMYILDGHHRVHAAMRLGQDVPINLLSKPGKYPNIFDLQNHNWK